MAHASPAADTSDREIVTTRTIDARRELVFRAWTSPEHLARWWGPRGFSTTTHAFDFRPGGEWRLTMHGPDGTDYENSVVYEEIAAPERIVYAHRGDGGKVHFRSTVTFVEERGKTTITMRGVFPTKADRDRVIEKFGALEGAKQTVARLAEHVGAMPFVADEKRPIVTMTRVFDAPRRIVFEAMTRPEHLARWWGPRAVTTEVRALDVRPGGSYHFVCCEAGGREHPFKGEYREVVPPERLVLTQRYDVPPFDRAESVVDVRLEEIGGRTLLTLVQTFGSLAERDAYVATGAERGSRESHDRLAELVRTMS